MSRVARLQTLAEVQAARRATIKGTVFYRKWGVRYIDGRFLVRFVPT